MWIFTRYGFFSTVCARHGNGSAGNPVDSDCIMVRARVRSHLECLLQRFLEPLQMSADDIQQFTGSDYPFRIFVRKSTWLQVMEILVAEMDYDNFKSDVAEHLAWVGRHYETALHDVWGTMRGLEEAEKKHPSKIDLDAAPLRPRTAVGQDWKTHSLPKKRAILRPQRVYTALEMRQIRKGLIPQQMEDKWFAYWADETLFLHRSWTGFCIYVVRFGRCGDAYEIISAEANRHPKQYTEVCDARDAKMLCWLIDLLLLGKYPEYPSGESDSEAAAVEQWHQVGPIMFGPAGTPSSEEAGENSRE